MLSISNHAFKRAKERLGLNKKSFINTVEKAVNKNIGLKETKSKLTRYIYSIINRNDYKDVDTLLYGDFILLIGNDCVITVLKVPQELTPIKKYIK